MQSKKSLCLVRCIRGLAAVGLMLSVCCASAAAEEKSETIRRLEQLQVLDLETAAAVALSENPSLEQAAARIEQARQGVEAARSAYWPRLDAEASASRVDLSQSTVDQQLEIPRRFFPGFGIEDPEEYFTADLTASYLLFDGFARKFNLAAAQYGEQASSAAGADVRRLLLSAVSSSYLSAQQAQENILISTADITFNQRNLTESELRYKVGTGALSDVLNFQVQVNSAKANLILSEQSLRTRLIGLAALLGVPDAELPATVQLAPLSPPVEAELKDPLVPELITLAWQLRPDLQQTQFSVAQVQANAEVARADYYPEVALVASLNGDTTDDPGFSGDDFGNTIGINLTYNIFAGGLYKARHQQAKAVVYEVRKGEENLRIQVGSDVRQAAARLQSAQAQLELQQSNAELVQRNRDLVEKEYRAGVGSLVRLNEAQRDLVAAQVRLAGARVQLHQAWYELQTATGEILKSLQPK